MDRAEVKKKLDLFLRLSRQEQELRDHLETLSFAGSGTADVERAMSRQAEIMREIRTLRETKLLPLLEEVAAFTAERKSALFADEETP